ncbi:MAG: hypothetical protein Q8N10_15555 [Phenylobacterium sp.]|uniref:hypothetical protein n=1 Tax=Phenylobacterium sp. TaxID=1871053 RepID=UPI002722A6C2|nr:hypothetical protein [Phenylobacterium sp.]MDO8912637.1 hypothetical protein [Phenylobacterium sp.]MDP2012281.1 hypothetical protein [Phenylobacterium sp.]MDP3101903.1 hypothetical protein [Phenylobacterium sp.]HQT54828.1 hypothetical protein [Phenylobacterium sp.]
MRAAGLALMAALSLTACSDTDDVKVAKGICTPFAATPAATTTTAGVPALGPAAVADGAGPVEDCLHRWAYSLAGAKDSAEVVAEATIAACSSALSAWNQASLSGPAGPSDAISLVTGEPTSAIAEHRNFAANRALFFVVQARAGRCDPPPPVKG